MKIFSCSYTCISFCSISNATPHPRMLEHRALLTHQAEYSWLTQDQDVRFILYKLTLYILRYTCSKGLSLCREEQCRLHLVAKNSLSEIDPVWGASLWNPSFCLGGQCSWTQIHCRFALYHSLIHQMFTESFPCWALGQTPRSLRGKIGWTWFWLSRRFDSEFDLQIATNGYEQ